MISKTGFAIKAYVNYANIAVFNLSISNADMGAKLREIAENYGVSVDEFNKLWAIRDARLFNKAYGA